MARELVPPARPGARALDVGGGMAEFAEILRDRGYATDVAELSESNLAYARSLGLGTFRIDLNEGLPGIEDEAYAVVAMLEVIEHVVNAERLLEEGRRVLQPGGLLVLSTPNVAFVRDRLQALAGRPPVEEGYHYRFFTIAQMRRMLGDAGLRVVAERYSSPAVGLNVVRRKVLGHADRRHVMIPRGLAPLFGQTMYLLARRP